MKSRINLQNLNMKLEAGYNRSYNHKQDQKEMCVSRDLNAIWRYSTLIFIYKIIFLCYIILPKRNKFIADNLQIVFKPIKIML